MRDSTTDVVIVGAGPTGLTLALELARRGIDFRIVNRPDPSVAASRALGIQARTLEVLEDLGILEPCLEEGIRLQGTTVFTGSRLARRVPLDFTPSRAVPYPRVQILPQRRLEELMAHRLADLGSAVEQSTTVTGVEQDEQQVRVSLTRAGGDPERITCRYLVGCDGAYSQVRSCCGIPFEGETCASVYTLGEVAITWDLVHGESYQFLGEHRNLTAIPMPERNRYRLTTWESVPGAGGPDRVEHGVLISPPTLAQVQAMVDEVVPLPALVEDPSALQSYRVGRRLAARYRQGRVLLAGDAAHIVPPIGAQGMNTGIGDAYNLGWKLALVVAGKSPDRLLESYQAERRPVAASIVALTDRAMMDLATSILGSRGWVQLKAQAMLRRWSHLDVTYRHSSAVLDTASGLPEDALHAGDRAPDGVVQERCSRRKTRLFELFRGTDFHLLALPGDDSGTVRDVVCRVMKDYGASVKVHTVVESSSEVGHWIDESREVLRAYRPGGSALVLVRPDGYVGCSVSGSQAPVILEYLRNLIGSGQKCKSA